MVVDEFGDDLVVIFGCPAMLNQQISATDKTHIPVTVKLVQANCNLELSTGCDTTSWICLVGKVNHHEAHHHLGHIFLIFVQPSSSRKSKLGTVFTCWISLPRILGTRMGVVETTRYIKGILATPPKLPPPGISG